MQPAGLVIAVLAAVGITVVGALYLTRPLVVAESFGLPAVPPDSTAPWLRLKGVRDLTTGVVAATLLLVAEPVVVGWALLAFCLVPLGDLLVVLTARGRTGAAWGIHGVTALVMAVGALLLLT